MDTQGSGHKPLQVVVRDLGMALVELSRSLQGVLPADVVDSLGNLGDALLAADLTR